MKEKLASIRPAARRRPSLEQKIMRMVHRYRVAEKRRKQKEAAQSKRLHIAFFAPTGLAPTRSAVVPIREVVRQTQVFAY
jgi:hypothetical protein